MLYRLGALLLYAFFFVFTFLWYGHIRYQDGYKAAYAESAQKNARVHTQRAVVTTKIVTKYVPEIRTVYVQGATIIKRIPIYVTKKDNSACRTNVGFVRLWNAANTGLQLPATASSLDEETSPIILSEIAAEHTREATICRANEKQLEGLQAWVAAQYKVTLSNSK